MFGIAIGTGQLYYLQEHRRSDVIIDEGLRGKTLALIERLRMIWSGGRTPSAEYEKRKCDRCSLFDVCMPKSTGTGGKGVDRFIEAQLRLVQKTCAVDE
jgi:CRISPR-associated exonuclease Cas4